MDDRLARLALDDLRTAELNELYYRELGTLYSRLDLWSRVVTSVVASATVASWALASDPSWWKALSVGAAVASIVGTVFSWNERARKCRDVAARWTAIAGELRAIYLQLRDDPDPRAALLALAARADELQGSDVDAPSRRRIARLQAEVNQRHAHRVDPAA